MKNIKFKKLIFNVTNDLLQKGYELNDFKLYVEKYKDKIYLASFSNSESRRKDYGLGDTEKYVLKNKNSEFSQEVKRNESDIANNGKLVNHQKIFFELEKKEDVSLCK